MEEFPSNSRTRRVDVKEGPSEPKVEKKKIEKVVSGRVSRRRKPMGRRFMETMFGGEDAGGIWGWIAQEVLVPAAKSMITDAVSGGIERAVYGDVRHRPGASRAQPNGHRVAYSAMSSRTVQREDPRQLNRQQRATHDFDGLILDTRVDAEEVLDQMFEILSQYNVVTVADLYDMTGQSTNFADRAWGWINLQGSSITHVNGGFLLDLPRPVPVD